MKNEKKLRQIELDSLVKNDLELEVATLKLQVEQGKFVAHQLKIQLASKDLEDQKRKLLQLESKQVGQSNKNIAFKQLLSKKYKMKGNWGYDDETGEIDPE